MEPLIAQRAGPGPSLADSPPHTTQQRHVTSGRRPAQVQYVASERCDVMLLPPKRTEITPTRHSQTRPRHATASNWIESWHTLPHQRTHPSFRLARNIRRKGNTKLHLKAHPPCRYVAHCPACKTHSVEPRNSAQGKQHTSHRQLGEGLGTSEIFVRMEVMSLTRRTRAPILPPIQIHAQC